MNSEHHNLESEFLDDQTKDRYLRFYIDNDIYAVKLMDVQEVLEFTQPKKIPNTYEHFLGVLNVRGEIVGVIDFRKKMKYEKALILKPVLILLKTEHGSIAVMVDRLLDVQVILKWDDSVKNNLEVRVESEYLLGVSLESETFVVGIDLRKILSNEDVMCLDHSKILGIA
jgi:purine-binding chemotaxis protein CheW